MANNNIAEQDFRNGGRYDMEDQSHHPDDALRKIQTAGSLSISPELFEKIYLSPQNKVAGELRKTFGNPTPIALGGFLLSLSPLSNILLGWRHGGAAALGSSGIATYFFFGGLLMTFGGALEWILGNTFPAVVFTTFGAFWLSYGGTLQPYFSAAGNFDPTSPPSAELADPGFLSGFAFFLTYMGVLCFVYFICALRTNLVFVLIFTLLIPTFACLAMAFWRLAEGNAASSENFRIAGAGMAFGVCLLGWYLFAALLLASVDFPISLPVIDLSQTIKGASEKKSKESRPADEEQATKSKLKFWK